MSHEDNAPVSDNDVAPKSTTDAGAVVTDAGAEQAELHGNGGETAEAKAVVAAPSEVVKGEAVAAPLAGDSAEVQGAEESVSPAGEAEPSAAPEERPVEAVVEPAAALAPAPEPASEDAHTAGSVSAPGNEGTPAVTVPETSPAADAAAPDAADSAPPADGTAAAAAVEAPAAVPAEEPSKSPAKPDGQETEGGAPTANGNASPPAGDDAPPVQPGTVQELTKRLSGASLQLQPQPVTPARTIPAEKQQASVPVAAAAVLSAARAPSRSPSGQQRSGESSPVSTHDTKNTINVSQLLKLGAFKMQPLKDFVPYNDLLRLRVEDGIDATRKEDYLSDADFKEVFGMDRDTFKQQPAWRQAQAKKKANLY